MRLSSIGLRPRTYNAGFSPPHLNMRGRPVGMTVRIRYLMGSTTMGIAIFLTRLKGTSLLLIRREMFVCYRARDKS